MAVRTVQLGHAPARKVHPLEGFGAQLNTNLFCRKGTLEDVTPAQLQELRNAIGNLKLGHSRIFVQRGLRPDTAQGKAAPEFVALMKTIERVQEAGPHANVNLTWWGQGPYGNEKKLAALEWPNRNIQTWPQPGKRKWPDELTKPDHPRAITAPRVMMRRFALIVEEARRRGFTCVTHATIQNEVNGGACDIAKHKDPGLSRRFYELLYRLFDEELRKIRDPSDPSRTLRDCIKIVGGDLVENRSNPRNNQNVWLEYMHANMEVPREGFHPVLDGYSIHVYWDPRPGPQGFPQKLESRLRNLVSTIRNLPSDLPIYVTEYGVKKQGAKPEPGALDGQMLEHSPRVAFQHAWFNALAPQCGCAGLAKWVLYRTEPGGGFGKWGMIGSPQQQFERTPVYRVTRLFNHLVGFGWRPAGLGRGPGANVLVSKFASPDGAHDSVVVLNNGSQRQDVRVEGLSKSRRYFGADWNRDGKGTNNPLGGPVTTDAAGAALVHVPPHGAVGLSTRPLGL